jgi:hypothetical protein
MTRHATVGRRSLLVSAAGFALAARTRWARADAPSADSMGHFGSFVDQAEFARRTQALKPEIVAALVATYPNLRTLLGDKKPRHVLPNLPPVSTQGTPAHLGSPGSCEAQSFGYGLGTYTASTSPAGGFDSSSSLANCISAAWLYANLHQLENQSCPKGSAAFAYLDQLVAAGAPSEAQVPYKPDCTYLVPRSASNPGGIDLDIAHYYDVEKFKIGSSYAITNFQNAQATCLPLFKSHLRAGHAIAFSGLVANGYATSTSSTIDNGAFDPPASSFKAGSGHGQLVVGFDDSLGHTGAFLVQNSFGPGWPGVSGAPPLLMGRIWWTYEAFFASQKCAAIAYPLVIPHLPRPLPGTPMNPGQPGAPDASIMEVASAVDGATGEGHLVMQHAFAQPVMLDTVTVKTPTGATLTQQYGGAMAQGHTYVTQRGAFATGTYGVTLAARTIASAGAPSRSVTYSGNVHI